MRPAGKPSIRYDLQRPVAPFGGCRAHIEHLGDYTSVNALINPSIYTNYGLTYRDFFVVSMDVLVSLVLLMLEVASLSESD